jgi:hypothetical protein
MTAQENLTQIKRSLNKVTPQELGKMWKERATTYYKCSPPITISVQSDYDLLNAPLFTEQAPRISS